MRTRGVIVYKRVLPLGSYCSNIVDESNTSDTRHAAGWKDRSFDVKYLERIF